MTVGVASCMIVFLIVHTGQGMFVTCGQRRLSPIFGQKCDLGQAEALHTFGHQECVYTCLRRGSKCVSMSYNAVDELCSMTATPCLELVPHPDVRTNVFHDLMQDMSQCLQWTPYNGTSHGRSIVYDLGSPGTMRLVRWKDPQGNLLIGYLFKSNNLHRGFFKYTAEVYVTSPFTGCDMAMIREDCSVAWVTFTIGESVPSNAAAAGYIIGHGPVFVARHNHPTKRSYRFGYYMTGNPFLNHMSDDRYDIITFDIMVVV